MKRLYFAGKALPIEKKHPAYPSSDLKEMVDLDPRHGVFPNLVMTPLFATIMACHEDGDSENTTKLLDQAKDILCDRSARRFNVLSKPTGTKHRLAENVAELLKKFAPANDLWLVFKHSAAYALITYLLSDKADFSEGELNSYGAEFLRRCTEAPNCQFVIPAYKTTQVGLLFRLCTDDDPDGKGVTKYLMHAVHQMNPDGDANRIVAILRSFVPLLHNDAYDKTPIGLVQARFMAAQDLPVLCPNHYIPAPDIYWRFIGRVIKRRLLSPA